MQVRFRDPGLVRWIIRPLSIGIVVCFLLGTLGPSSVRLSADDASAAGTPLYPDLKTTKPSGLYFDRVTMSDGLSHYVLRFSNVVWNDGEGRLELQGDPRPDGGNKVYQNVYDSPTGGALASQRHVSSDIVYHPSHYHYHFEGFASYLMLQRDSAGVYQPTTKKGSKTGFCIMDSNHISSRGPSSAQYGSCSGALQGISVGWGDLYQGSLPEQWIDLGTSRLADGYYAVQSTADPQNKLNEAGRDNNNIGVTYFRVSSGAITIISDPPPPSVSNPTGAYNPSFAGFKAGIVYSGDSPYTGTSFGAYDNDLNTTWFSGRDYKPQSTLTIDLGASYDISGVKWKFHTLGLADQFSVAVANEAGGRRGLGIFGNVPYAQTFYGVGTSDAVYARYVIFDFTNVGNDAAMGSISELEVWARGYVEISNPPGTENPSLAGSKAQIVSSGDDPPTGLPPRAHDNDLNSTWYIGGSPSSATLTLDLGATYDVSGVKWKFYSLGYMDQFTVSARNVQGQSRALGTFGNGSKTQVFYGVGVSDTVYARYVDIRVTNVNNDFYLGSVSEIEVWARNAPQVTNPAGTENPSLAGTKAPITGSFDSPSTGISGRSYDNDLNSTWYLGGFPTNATLTLDLGATYDVSGVKWKLYSLGYLDQFTVSARNVQGQSRLLGTFGNPSRTQVFYGVGVSDAVYARYVDIRVTNVNGDEYLGSVSEIEIWSRGFIAASDGVSSASASPTATVAATATPTSIPSPTTTPTASPTEAPTVTPTASPTEESTPTEAIATPSVTAEPTTTPTEEIAATPAALPTEESTPTATPSPTATPTEEVAASLATLPTEGPTEDPTVPPTVALDAVTTGVVAGTGGQNVRCRAEPSTDGAVLDEIAEGETVSVIGPEVDGWIPVTCGEGAAGFVSAGFVRLDGEQPLETVTDATATVTATDEVATAESSTGSSPAAGPTEDVPTAVSTGAPTPEPTAVPAETPFPVVRVTDSEQSETGFRAIDQDPETIWSVYPSVSPDEVWLLLDLGEVRPIERVTYELGLRNTLPVFEIWLSEDGETWWNAAIIDGRTVEPNVEYEELLGLDARFAMLVVPDAVASGLGEIGGFREIGVWPGEATQSLSVLGNPTTPEPLPEPPPTEEPTEAVIEDSPVVSAEATEITAPPPDEPAAEAAAPADAPVEPDPGATDAIEEPTAEPLNET